MTRSSRRLLVVPVVLATVGGLATGCTGDDASPQQDSARAFLDAVGHGDLTRAAAQTTGTPSAVRTSLAATVDGLGRGARAAFEVGSARTDGDRATVSFTATWTLPGTRTRWRYPGRVDLIRRDGRWRVAWHAHDLHPGLRDGERLQLRRTFPTRAALESADGKPLFTPTPVVEVGIEPRLVDDLPKLARTLAAVPALQTTKAQVVAAVRAAARPTDFVPVITLRRPAYDRIRARIHSLDGTVFRESTPLLPPSATFGRALLGRVGPATAEQIAKARGRLAAGDPTGVGGLQQALDTRLAGTPRISVDAATKDGARTRTLASLGKPDPGTAVRLTIDRATQSAADGALERVRQQASIVAVRMSTGEILADANSAPTTYDLGLSGAVPPGSTFKIATWTAAFTARPELTASSVVPCPATTTVDGRTFVNENKFSYPPVPISAAFGYSCNTSAIRTAMSLPRDAVRAAARRLGLGARWDLPVPAFSGTMPTPAGRTEQAADAIGQGRVLASPLLMALIAGAAASGRPVRPSLIAGADPAPGATLPAALVSRMSALMTATVALPRGTGHELAGLGGVRGKTGTAEYGDAKPPRSHSWFAGVRGDIAFAVFVYDGASSGTEAVGLTRTFLRSLR